MKGRCILREEEEIQHNRQLALKLELKGTNGTEAILMRVVILETDDLGIKHTCE